jgi:diguanylate cyclase (GGDEF)-like protein
MTPAAGTPATRAPSGRPGADRWAWRGYLIIGGLGIACYYFIPAGLWRDGAYVVMGGSCVAAICVGVHLHRPQRRLPWYLMAIGQLSWVIGDAVDSWYQDVDKLVPFPSLADAFYLGAYPVLAVALLLLIRRRRPGRDPAELLDTTIVTAGLGVLSWVVLARPTIAESQQSLAASVVGLAYPMADILLIALLTRLITTSGGRTPAFRLLLLAVGLLVLGDTASDLVSLASSSTSAFDFLWLCSYVLWGAAALHPSMRTLSDAVPNRGMPFSVSRLLVLAVAVLIAPATLAVELVTRSHIDGWAFVVSSVVLFLLVVARMNLAIDQIMAVNRQREQLQEDLAYQATHDSLTGLPNRAQALHLIEGALHRAQRTGAIVGLLFFDLDDFKLVNDTFGHRVGDEVLSQVAQRMLAEVRGGDIVARLGGDEFVVLLEPVDTEASVVDIANRLIEGASAAITTSTGHEVVVGASAGAAFSLDGSTDAEHLLGEADVALYRAKSLGRGRVEVFDESLRRELHDRAHFESAIEDGLRDGEFVLHYQPVIDVQTQQLEGFEALIRWDRPGIGQLAPDQFIPMAEASPLIRDLDCWVLHQALAQLAEWTSADAPPGRQITMAVNISGRHVSDPRIVADVEAALRSSGVDADRVILEITETILMDNLRAIRHLESLRDMGVAISIDDFGTGYNSILQLQNLPVDGIKIDRSFLASTHPASDKLIVLIVQAAHAFGLPVIAEGVERPDQLETLRQLDCDYAQGYLFARPLTAVAAEQFMQHRAPEFDPRPAPSSIDAR